METAPRNVRRFTKLILLPIEIGIVGVVPSLTLFRLGNMHLDGLPTAFAAGLALLVALTSLLFNRARAYPIGRVQRRTLLAAELSLRAAITATFGVIVAAFVFPYLESSGYKTTPWQLPPTQGVPAIAGFVVALVFLRASFLLLFVGRVIAPSLLSSLTAKQIARATKQ